MYQVFMLHMLSFEVKLMLRVSSPLSYLQVLIVMIIIITSAKDTRKSYQTVPEQVFSLVMEQALARGVR